MQGTYRSPPPNVDSGLHGWIRPSRWICYLRRIHRRPPNAGKLTKGSSTFSTELWAIHMALDSIFSLPTRPDQIVIPTDSRASVAAISCPNPQSHNPTVMDSLRLTNCHDAGWLANHHHLDSEPCRTPLKRSCR